MKPFHIISLPKGPEEREPIDPILSPQDMIMLMGEGNPGAMTVLAHMMGTSAENLPLILDLDDMNIRGTQIWVGYKLHCEQDLKRFIQCVKDRDEKMVEAINTEGRRGNHPHMAVKRGASNPGGRRML